MLFFLIHLAQAKQNMDSRPADSENILFIPGKGLRITSTDQDFSMTIRLRSQLLYTLAQDPNQAWTQSLQNRRSRLSFQGNVFGEHNKYKFELAISPKDIGLVPLEGASRSPLLDYYFYFDRLDNLNIRMGQYKVPYSRQRVVSSGNLQLVDRSLANAEFNLDRDIGLDLYSKNLFQIDKLRYHLGIYMGEGHSSYQDNALDFMSLGRLEFLPFGNFRDYSESSFTEISAPKLSIGLALAHVDEAKRNKGIIGDIPSDEGTTDTRNATADICYRQNIFSLDSAIFWREGSRNTAEADSSLIEKPRNGLGYYVQAGIMLPKQIELAGRYGQIMPNTDETSLSKNQEMGVGLNHYIAQHSFKIQGDYFRLWEADIEDGKNRVRLQIQLAY